MDDIVTVPLKTLQDNLNEYKKQKVKIAEFIFYVTGGMIYDDYYITVGPSGGVTINYDGGKKLSVGKAAIEDGTLDKGIVHTRSQPCGYGKTRTVVLPPHRQVPKLLAQAEKQLIKSVAQYDKTLKSTIVRLEKITELSNKFPEYSL